MPDAAAQAILAHACRDAPLEACGLLVGAAHTVVRIAPTPNGDASPSRYTIPADVHFAVIRAARLDALEVIGAYHSHPRSPAVPSPTDTALAFAGFVFVIAAIVPTPHLRAWRFDDGNFTEVGLVRT